MKAILEKEDGREISWEEASKLQRDLETFAEIIAKAALEEFRKDKILEESQKGNAPPASYVEN